MVTTGGHRRPARHGPTAKPDTDGGSPTPTNGTQRLGREPRRRRRRRGYNDLEGGPTTANGIQRRGGKSHDDEGSPTWVREAPRRGGWAANNDDEDRERQGRGADNSK